MRTAALLTILLALVALSEPAAAADTVGKDTVGKDSLGKDSVGKDAASKDTVDVIRDDDAAMAKAVVEARATLPTFFATAASPKPGMRGFAVKVGIGPAGGREFVWITPFTVAGDALTGQIANEPERVTGYHSGQTLKLPLTDVTDWTYLDRGKMKGNFSACALMGRKTEAEKADFRRRYDLDCAAP